jgi:HSP20 family molecular chaperone IbpA
MYTTRKDLIDFFNSLEDVVMGGIKASTDSIELYPNSFPATDVFVHNKEKDLILEMALAGIPKDHIHVSIEGDYLVLEIDKVDRDKKDYLRYQKGIKASQCKRKFFVHSGKYDLGKLKVTFNDGLLSIFVPAKEGQKRKEIKIES